jgi:hypothetical protein
MYYTASSVIAALKASTKCTCEELDNVKCPKNGCTPPEKCALAKKQKCVQSVTIFDKNKNPSILQFRFPDKVPPSAANNDGFINKDNASLKRLIYKNIINIDSLQER